MSTDHHTPHAFGAPLTAVEMNTPLAELDAAIADLDTVIATGSGASTSLTAQASAGQATLVVASSADFAVGDPIYIGTGATFESRIIATVPDATHITVTVNLSNTYAAGTPVSKSPVEIVDARGGYATLGVRQTMEIGKLSTVAAAGATETIDLTDGSVHDVTLSANCTFAFAGAVAGSVYSFTLLLRQNGTGGWTATWPGSVVWPEGVAPWLDKTASAVAVLTFFTSDGGTIWYGFTASGGYVSPRTYRAAIMDTPGHVSGWRLSEATGIVAVDSEDLRNGAYTGWEANLPDLGVAGLLANDPSTAVYFDGPAKNAKVTIAHSAALTPTALTVCGWIKVAAADIGQHHTLAIKRNSSGWILRASITSGYPTFNTSLAGTQPVFSTSIADGLPHFLMGVIEGARIVLRVDDFPEIASALAGSVGDTSTLYLGNDGQNGFWGNTTVQAVDLFNRALTDDERMHLYRIGSGT